jgi:hypothetical protein
MLRFLFIIDLNSFVQHLSKICLHNPLLYPLEARRLDMHLWLFVFPYKDQSMSGQYHYSKSISIWWMLPLVNFNIPYIFGIFKRRFKRCYSDVIWEKAWHVFCRCQETSYLKFFCNCFWRPWRFNYFILRVCSNFIFTENVPKLFNFLLIKLTLILFSFKI